MNNLTLKQQKGILALKEEYQKLIKLFEDLKHDSEATVLYKVVIDLEELLK
jgi:hypothetical protein